MDDIWDYYSENVSETEADRLITRLLNNFDLLSDYPHMGRDRPEFAPGIRSHAATPYVIWYYIWQSEIEISRILHGSQNIEQFLG